jgi:hypothetical protein
MSIKSIWRQRAAAVAVGSIALLAATQASADAIAVVTNAANYTFVAGWPIVPGTVTPAFANLVGQRFLVTFSAECAVNAPAGNNTAWLDVDIVVRNAAGAIVATLAPTVGAGDAFCSSNGTPGFDGWATQSITAVGGAGLPAGVYSVAVRARLNNGATGGWLGERSTVVWR